VKGARKFLTPLTTLSLCLACSSLCAAQQDWLLSTADFQTESVSLKSIDEKGVHVAASGQSLERVVTPEAFLQIDRTGGAGLAEKSPSKFMLELVTGDRVGGEPLKAENDRLAWRNAAVGVLTIPLTQLAAITKANQNAGAPNPVDSIKRTEDVVTLANGDAVRGIVVSIAADHVQVKSGGPDDAPVTVPLDNVVSIHFASAGPAATNPAGSNMVRAYRVRLQDGSSLVGSSLSLSGDKVSFVIGTGGTADKSLGQPIELASVAGIEQVNGPVSWLTSRRPSEDVQIPFVGTSEQFNWKTRTDADVTGQPIVVGGQVFKRGIGVHSYSRLVYALDGKYKAFRTRHGINDNLVRADVTVRIRVDDKLVHEQKNVRPGVLSPVVTVELPASAKQLVLEVDYGEGIDVEDRLNWIEPALLREVPKPAPATTKPAK
jgi:hypothetical protein